MRPGEDRPLLLLFFKVLPQQQSKMVEIQRKQEQKIIYGTIFTINMLLLDGNSVLNTKFLQIYFQGILKRCWCDYVKLNFDAHVHKFLLCFGFDRHTNSYRRFPVTLADRQEEHTEQITQETCTGARRILERRVCKQEKQRITKQPILSIQRGEIHSAVLAGYCRGKDGDRETQRHEWRAPSLQALLTQTPSFFPGAFLVCIYTPLHILFASSLFSTTRTVSWWKPISTKTPPLCF